MRRDFAGSCCTSTLLGNVWSVDWDESVGALTSWTLSLFITVSCFRVTFLDKNYPFGSINQSLSSEATAHEQSRCPSNCKEDEYRTEVSDIVRRRGVGICWGKDKEDTRYPGKQAHERIVEHDSSIIRTILQESQNHRQTWYAHYTPQSRTKSGKTYYFLYSSRPLSR